MSPFITTPFSRMRSRRSTSERSLRPIWLRDNLGSLPFHPAISADPGVLEPVLIAEALDVLLAHCFRKIDLRDVEGGPPMAFWAPYEDPSLLHRVFHVDLFV